MDTRRKPRSAEPDRKEESIAFASGIDLEQSRLLPSNIVEVARVLVSHDFGPKAGAETIRLLLTSKQASEAGVAVPLIDLLIRAGARMDWSRRDLLDNPLLNVAPATARALLRRGAKMEFRHAAGLADLEALRRLHDPEQLNDALMYACIRGQTEAAAWLIRRGAQGDVLLQPVGQTPRTALKRRLIEVTSRSSGCCSIAAR